MNRYATAIVGALAIGTPLAHAGFIGLPLQVTYYAEQSGFGFSTYDVAVTPFDGGTQFHGFGDGAGRTFDIDVGDDVVIISNFNETEIWNRLDFNGLLFSNGDDAPLQFTSIDVVSSDSAMPGLNDARLSFDPHQLKVNWSGLDFSPGMVVELRVGFSPVPTTPDTSSVPAPTAGPAGLALVATLLIRRRRVAA